MTTPTARIVLDGKDITTRILNRDDTGRNILVSLTVTDEAGIKSDTAELVLDNGRGGFEAPPVGALMQVWMGYEPKPVYMGQFRVDEWTKSGAPNILTVSAKAAELTTEIKGHKTRAWHDTTLGDIVREIAGSHALGTVMDEMSNRAVEHIDQHNESDLNFLSRLARRNGAVFKLADGKVYFAKRGAKFLPSGKSKATITVKPVDVSTWSMTRGERGGHKSVKAMWHDHDGGKRHAVTAGSGKPCHRLKTVYRTAAEAKAAAEGELAALHRGKYSGTLEMAGNPDFYAEAQVAMSGFDKDVDATFNAKSVTHTFDSGGYRTSVTLEAGTDSEADSSE